MIKVSKKTRRLVSRGMLTTTIATGVAPVVSPFVSFAEQESSVSGVTFEKNKGLKIAIISDTHIFPEEYVGNEGPNYLKYVSSDRKMLKESERILDSSINRILKSDAEIVLIPGDLTKDSEVKAHEILAREIEKLEKAGKEVFVINGNHDINAPDAEKFIAVEGDENDPNRTDRVEKLDGIKASEFEKLYAKYGFDDQNLIANDPNSTSYVARLKPGYRLIAMDTGIYGDNKSDQSTAGKLQEDTRLKWILDQIKEANKAGDTVIGMSHHGIVEHFNGQGKMFAPYLVENYEKVSTTLADAGMKYVFTGHFHAQDVAIKKTEAGNTIMDIMTGSSVSYPSPIRFVQIDNDLGKIHIKSERVESIKGVEDFKKYSEDAMRSGVGGMVSSLASDLLIGMIDNKSSSTPNGDEEKIKEVVKEYITQVIDENKDKLDEEINKNPELLSSIDVKSIDDPVIIPGEDGKPPLLKKSQLINYIKAVSEDLKTVEVETSIAKNYKLMDIIENCLIEVYAGDENYSDSMKILKSELQTTPMIQDSLVKILVKNKKELGLVGTLVNEDSMNKLFDKKVSGENTLGQVVGNTFAQVLDGVLTDKTPDNNVAYIGDRVVDSDLGTSTPSITPPTIPSTTPQIIPSKLAGDDRYKTAVEISKEGWNKSDTVFIVSGEDKNLVDGLTATPLASSKDAPILLTKNNSLANDTINEIKRLNSSQVIVIGGQSSISESVVKDIKNINSNIEVKRIAGSNRYETSLNIAKELDKTNDVSKVYIGSGDGESDSLSISPVAGKERAPILLTPKEGPDKNTLEFIKDKAIKDSYFIGGKNKISDSSISKINDIIPNDVSKNRISGKDRQETNARVMEKFYKNTDLNGVAVAKSDQLVDALSVGPLAAKKDIPIILATKTLNKSQEEALNKKKTLKLFEIGGGISSSVLDKIKNLVK
ncbi:cell wall-binding repeat-containing protein [Asaccharospora irregularis]|uniref:3',5'-cyclic AMP phosphodiesterase CpdA n=1 Tax=Asaccharospora irregularis DSM 2635 TaxID=1121321 RepID=A0A1M5M8N5_9FIRM|nr:cell wall-binding repeat-containing protein [Asaccharospora irregularis]SHG73620.1 3',5'-cyclic AMP phosphodiesterase CpdA [Asaccharospora irregularis DSM 2635]